MPSKIDSPAWLGTADAARALGVALITLKRWSRRDGAPIRPVMVARRLRWRVSDIERLLREGER